MVDAYRGRPDTVLALGSTIAIVVVGLIGRGRVTAMAYSVVTACAAVWVVVPDTEAPLIAAAVVGAALVRPPAAERSRWAGLLLAMPVSAAVVGTAGRPSRLGLAVVLVVATAGASLVVTAGIRRVKAQRAGTPTTVVSASTSSTTTAPAPTTAR